jgi:diguanylate cyclase (GGDEF)-like protein
MRDIPHVRVLLVEDDDEDAEIFERHLNHVAQHSALILRARTAGEAERVFEQQVVDVACVDLNLGGDRGAGLEVLRRIRSKPDAPPVVIVTGSGDEEAAAEALRRGANDYLVKDQLSPQLLDRTIRTVRENHALEIERRRMMVKLAELSVTDDLTGVANRRHLISKLQEELIRAERTGHLFAVVLIDLDGFKHINDTYGHQVGDDVLRSCARAIAANVRASDFVARQGGDEFCVILPNASPRGAQRAADKIREAIDAQPTPVPTASVGVALWEPGMSSDAIMQRADEALYQAKARGRNCAVAGA